jgi:hypothetical protein
MLNDYLEIAYLRGGINAAPRVATMNSINVGLDIDRAHRLVRIDETGPDLAAGSFARKRSVSRRDASWRTILRAIKVPAA